MGEKVRILLITPTALDPRGEPVRYKRLLFPATTMPMLAAVTPEEDVEVKIVYETVEDIPYDEHWDIVGLTGMGSGIIRAWQLGDEFRKRGSKVVIGGVGPTLCKQEWTLDHADTLVLGEAEDTWPQLIRDYQRGELKQIYQMKTPPDMAKIPTPRYDMMNLGRFGFMRSVQATRGCPFSCKFCSVTAFAKRGYRKRPVEKVIEDIRAAKKTGSRFICFLDDNIGVDFNYCKELWEALIPEKIIWLSQCSLQISERPDMLDLAYRSGCRLLAFGIESLEKETLKIIDKEWNRPERYQKAFQTIRRHGIEVSISMIMGMDGESRAVFQKTYDFIMDNKIPIPRLHLLTPTPGTPLYDEMEAENRLLTTDIRKYTGGQVVFKPKFMSPDELYQGYWKLYDKLFTWKNIIKRIGRNHASLEPLYRTALIYGNLNYRSNIRNRIIPGNT